MACFTPPPSEAEYRERTEVVEQLDSLNERATHGADLMREYLLGNVAAQRILPLVNGHLGEEFDKLEKMNQAHWVKADGAYIEIVRELVHEYEDLNELVGIVGKDSLTSEQKAVIEARQIQHRRDDLARLMKKFAEEGDTVRLRAVIDADPSEPLHVQLGFDPDEF